MGFGPGEISGAEAHFGDGTHFRWTEVQLLPEILKKEGEER
jgi:hypothetical protein